MAATPEALHLLQVKELSQIVITGDYRWGRATGQDCAPVGFQFWYWIVGGLSFPQRTKPVDI